MKRATVLGLALLLSLLSAQLSRADVFTWVDSTGVWSDTNQWLEVAAPTGTNNTDILIFGGSTPTVYGATNDLAAPPAILNQIILTNAAAGVTQTIAGNQIAFAGATPKLLQNGSDAFAIQNNVALSNNTEFAGTGAGRLTMNGQISGPGGLTKNSSGTLVFNGNSTYAGDTIINSGLLQGTGSLASAVIVNSGATLTGALTISNDATVNGSTMDGAGTVTGNVTIENGGLVTGSNTLGSVVVTNASTLAGSGTVTGSVTVHNGSTLTGTRTIGNNATINGGTMDGGGTVTGNVTVKNGGLVTGSNTLGSVVITNASILTGSGTVVGNVTVDNGGTLTGTRTVGSLTVNKGGVIAPGNSPGTNTVIDDALWNAGGKYIWDINNFTGSLGNNPGWDWLKIGGTLDIASFAADPFIIQITGSSPTYFSNQFVIATAAGGILNYDAGDIFLNTSSFSGPSYGKWTIGVGGLGNTQLLLTYTVPEPSLIMLLAVGAAVLFWHWRQVRGVDHS